jgi:uncharacterized membrane protein
MIIGSIYISIIWDIYYYCHFTEEETEAQEDRVVQLREVTRLGFET